MGWSYGINQQGREVGYSVQATCDWPGCTKRIDRGLAHCCGDMHDATDVGCANYFCGKHRQGYRRVADPTGRRYVSVCSDCAKPPSKRRKVALRFEQEGLQDVVVSRRELLNALKEMRSFGCPQCRRPGADGERCPKAEMYCVMRIGREAIATVPSEPVKGESDEPGTA